MTSCHLATSQPVMLINVMPVIYLIIGKLDDTNLILARASFENSYGIAVHNYQQRIN